MSHANLWSGYESCKCWKKSRNHPANYTNKEVSWWSNFVFNWTNSEHWSFSLAVYAICGRGFPPREGQSLIFLTNNIITPALQSSFSPDLNPSAFFIASNVKRRKSIKWWAKETRSQLYVQASICFSLTSFVFQNRVLLSQYTFPRLVGHFGLFDYTICAVQTSLSQHRKKSLGARYGEYKESWNISSTFTIPTTLQSFFVFKSVFFCNFFQFIPRYKC